MGTICHEHEGGGGEDNERFQEWPKWIRKGQDLGIGSQKKGDGNIILMFCRVYFSHDQIDVHIVTIKRNRCIMT